MVKVECASLSGKHRFLPGMRKRDSWCQSGFCINERKESLWDGLHQLNAQFFILVNLSLRFINHQPLYPLHSPAQSFFSTGFLSFRNTSHFHAAVSEMEHDYLLFPGVRAISDTLEHLVTSTFILLLPYCFINV